MHDKVISVLSFDNPIDNVELICKHPEEGFEFSPKTFDTMIVGILTVSIDAIEKQNRESP